VFNASQLCARSLAISVYRLSLLIDYGTILKHQTNCMIDVLDMLPILTAVNVNYDAPGNSEPFRSSLLCAFAS
jgi:hypothetical protein